MREKQTSHGIYLSGGKRALDVFAAIAGLVLLLPIFTVIAIISKLTSQGPVFYWQQRVGKSGRIFKIVKFRTMQIDADKQGPNITASGDSRITSTGRIIRNIKLDELPQLWNVIKGEMSFVGPRPELPLYVKAYTEEQKKVLAVRPGITDPASIVYRHEEKMLAEQANPERYYQEIILPHKLSLNAEYIRNMSLMYDLSLLAKTLPSLFSSRAQYAASVVPHR